MEHLDPRLNAIYGLCAGAGFVMDVGCDHGKLACALLRGGAAQRVLATDVSPASLAKAAARKRRCSLGHRLTLALGNGLAPLGEDTADVIVIAGLGGEAIAAMLGKDVAAARRAGRLILQPMSRSGHLRRWLCENGFRIAEEALAQDGGRIYEIIVAASGEDPLRPPGWPPGLYEVGWLPFARRDPLARALLKKKLAARRKALREAGAAAPAQLSELVEQLTALFALWEGQNQCV